jgi:hypothetical protein
MSLFFGRKLEMKPNNETIRISERPGDDRKVYEVLREWGYSEHVIQRLLAGETTLDHNSQKAKKD